MTGGPVLFMQAACPGCDVVTVVPACHVTVTPSYVGWWCHFRCAGPVWLWTADVGVRGELVDAGARWVMEDPLTVGDVEDLRRELLWAGDTFGDRLVEALELEGRS